MIYSHHDPHAGLSRQRIKCLIAADPDHGPDPITWEIAGIPTADVIDAFACLRRMYPLDATMPQYKLLGQPDGAPSAPSIRAVTPCGRIEVNVMGPAQVASTPATIGNSRAILFARCAETMPGRTMMVDALLRWLAPFHSRLPRLLVDISPADIAGMIPPGGASLTMYNIKAATLDLLETTYRKSIGTTAGHKVAGSCSLLVAPEGLGIGLLLGLLSRNAHFLSRDARHVHGIMRNAALQDLGLLSMVYEQADPT